MSPFDVNHFRFIRDSRHAYGNRFEVEKKGGWAEWIFCIAGTTCGVLSVLFMSGHL